jgi:hypothetical protein
MADSGQRRQPKDLGPAATQVTATVDCNALVCEILEMHIEMDVKRIDFSCFKIFFENLLRQLPSITPEDGAQQLHRYPKTLQKKMEMEQREMEMENQSLHCLQDDTMDAPHHARSDARACSVGAGARKKCQEVRDFAMCFIKMN